MPSPAAALIRDFVGTGRSGRASGVTGAPGRAGSRCAKCTEFRPGMRAFLPSRSRPCNVGTPSYVGTIGTYGGIMLSIVNAAEMQFRYETESRGREHALLASIRERRAAENALVAAEVVGPTPSRRLTSPVASRRGRAGRVAPTHRRRHLQHHGLRRRLTDPRRHVGRSTRVRAGSTTHTRAPPPEPGSPGRPASADPHR